MRPFLARTTSDPDIPALFGDHVVFEPFSRQPSSCLVDSACRPCCVQCPAAHLHHRKTSGVLKHVMHPSDRTPYLQLWPAPAPCDLCRPSPRSAVSFAPMLLCMPCLCLSLGLTSSSVYYSCSTEPVLLLHVDDFGGLCVPILHLSAICVLRRA